MSDIEEPLEDEDEVVDLEDDDEEVVAPDVQVEESYDVLVSKSSDVVDEEDDEDSLLALAREDRLEPLAIRAAPKQPNEFICKSCHLVKHNSQLADKKRQFCRDCV